MSDFSNDNNIKNIHPENITKPIQLLAAWLIGLVATNATFLSASILITATNWTHHLLVIASVVNVPIFLFSMFILQTKFRPELQEDSYYSQYILTNTGKKIKRIDAEEMATHQVSEVTKIVAKNTIGFDLFKYKVAINDYIHNYKEIVSDLNKAGIPVVLYFGKRTGVEESPEKWVIAIDKNMDAESIHIFLSVMIKYASQFSGFFFDNSNSPDPESIYIGGYVTDRHLFALEESIIENIYKRQISNSST